MTEFEYDFQEDTYNGLEGWLEQRRDEHRQPSAWQALDELLREVRKAGVEGYLPWQR